MVNIIGSPDGAPTGGAQQHPTTFESAPNVDMSPPPASQPPPSAPPSTNPLPAPGNAPPATQNPNIDPPSADVTSGVVKVDTTTLKGFGKGMDDLIDLLRPLVGGVGLPSAAGSSTPINVLGNIDVAPGAFYNADMVRTQINGVNGDSGLKMQYTNVVNSIAKVLADVRDGVNALADKYHDTEQLAKLSAADIQTYFAQAQSDLSALVNASSPPPAAGGSSN